MKIRVPSIPIFLITFLFSACASQERLPAGVRTLPWPGLERAASHEVVFMTDFGTQDDAVAVCKGAMLAVDPGLHIIDLTHQVKPYSIRDAARYLVNTSQYFPSGTVFVAVVDPTVGSARKAIVALSKKGQYFVLPDNGLITFVMHRDGIELVREITNTDWMLQGKASSTFHGRDIFSPVGARVASGQDCKSVGPDLDPASLVRLDIKAPVMGEKGLEGEATSLDGPFGNLITNLDGKAMQELGYVLGDRLSVRVGLTAIPVRFTKTFSDVPLNQDLLYFDENGLIAFATNQGNFAEKHHIRPPAGLFIPRKNPKREKGATSSGIDRSGRHGK